MLDVAKDGIAQLRDAAKTVPPDSLLGDFSEETFHLIEPTAVGRDKVQMPARMLGNPEAHLWSFVRGVIIQHRVNRQTLRRGGFQLLEKS